MYSNLLAAILLPFNVQYAQQLALFAFQCSTAAKTRKQVPEASSNSLNGKAAASRGTKEESTTCLRPVLPPHKSEDQAKVRPCVRGRHHERTHSPSDSHHMYPVDGLQPCPSSSAPGIGMQPPQASLHASLATTVPSTLPETPLTEQRVSAFFATHAQS